ncbi:MAG: DUF1189 domain-containing protein [Nitrospiraceae bacterium]|nr:MAG: DUF1189 domain-containing protein [Nitrospiraceae bacterium]
MKKYNFLDSLYLSFYSKPFYHDIALNWKGLCFTYLLFILCILWIPETSRIHSELSEFLSAEAPKYIKQVPPITITQGKASIKEPVPYYINVPEKNTPFAIIDTSGQITSLEKTSALLLLTDSKLIIKNRSSQSRSFDLAEIGDLTIDQKVVREWIDSFDALFPVILFPFVLFFSFFFHVIQALVAAGIGTLFAKRFQANLNYKTLIRLSAVSFTPAIFLQAIHAVLDIPFPYRLPVSFLISLGYLYYAVGSNAESIMPGAKKTL